MDQPESHAESSAPGQSQLRGFWGLILTQFEGAFNDNALKMVVTFVGLNMALSMLVRRMGGTVPVIKGVSGV